MIFWVGDNLEQAKDRNNPLKSSDQLSLGMRVVVRVNVCSPADLLLRIVACYEKSPHGFSELCQHFNKTPFVQKILRCLVKTWNKLRTSLFLVNWKLSYCKLIKKVKLQVKIRGKMQSNEN